MSASGFSQQSRFDWGEFQTACVLRKTVFPYWWRLESEALDG
jgi:hypothetical protein